jgi:hypothetical protein
MRHYLIQAALRDPATVFQAPQLHPDQRQAGICDLQDERRAPGRQGFHARLLEAHGRRKRPPGTPYNGGVYHHTPMVPQGVHPHSAMIQVDVTLTYVSHHTGMVFRE